MKFRFLIILLLFINICVSSQETQSIQLNTEPEADTILMLEKVYLHTDRLSYVSGEDLWYKAYLVDAENHRFTSHSNNLYAELISPENEVVQRQNIHIFEGKGHGDFQLSEELKTGTYYLRAYTNWMRNFEESIYYKPINIVSISEKNTNTNPTLYKADVDLQFFPEGGSLLNQVNSNVAFKAINPLGMGIEVVGHILDSNNDTITEFQSSHLGMGRFNFTPIKDLEYVAIGKTNEGFLFKTKLPKAMIHGINLKVSFIYEDQIIISIATNQEGLASYGGKELIIKNSCNKLNSITRLKIKNLSETIILPVFSFPAGISKLSLSTVDELILAERLVFIPKHQDLKIDIKPDSSVYHPRSKVNLDFEIKGEIEGEVLANFSLSAVDQSSINEQDQYASNIASYYLIESEVKGFIEQPAHYFNSNNEKRFEHLDLLLMTQAWRDFKWKYQADSISNLSYAVENEFSIVERLRIYIDSTINPPPAVNPNSYLKTELNKAIIDDIQADAFYKQMIKTRYGLKDTVVLDEFEKVANRIIKEVKDEHPRIYQEPADVMEMTGYELGYKNIVEYLRGRVAGLEILGQEPNIIIQIRGPGSLMEGSEPLWLLDGMPVERDRIMDFEMEEIDKIEVLKSGAQIAIFGLRGKNGVISVLSKQAGYGLDGMKKASKQKVLGKYDYFKQRKFYTPKYDTSANLNQAPDYRTTIHWEPYIYTDENNKANISFYNSDQSTNIEIWAEGLTESGIPIIGKTTYKVK